MKDQTNLNKRRSKRRMQNSLQHHVNTPTRRSRSPRRLSRLCTSSWQTPSSRVFHLQLESGSKPCTMRSKRFAIGRTRALQQAPSSTLHSTTHPSKESARKACRQRVVSGQCSGRFCSRSVASDMLGLRPPRRLDLGQMRIQTLQ